MKIKDKWEQKGWNINKHTDHANSVSFMLGSTRLILKLIPISLQGLSGFTTGWTLQAWVSPRMETAQPLWVTLFDMLLSSWWRNVSCYPAGTSCSLCHLLSFSCCAALWEPGSVIPRSYGRLLLGTPKAFSPSLSSLVPLSGTCCSSRVSFLHWGIQNWMWPSRCGLRRAEQRRKPHPCGCWLCCC